MAGITIHEKNSSFRTQKTYRVYGYARGKVNIWTVFENYFHYRILGIPKHVSKFLRALRVLCFRARVVGGSSTCHFWPIAFAHRVCSSIENTILLSKRNNNNAIHENNIRTTNSQSPQTHQPHLCTAVCATKGTVLLSARPVLSLYLLSSVFCLFAISIRFSCSVPCLLCTKIFACLQCPWLRVGIQTLQLLQLHIAWLVQYLPNLSRWWFFLSVLILSHFFHGYDLGSYVHVIYEAYFVSMFWAESWACVRLNRPVDPFSCFSCRASNSIS